MERILLHPGKLPDSLSLSLKGEKAVFELGRNAQYKQRDWETNHGWNVEQSEDPSSRHRIYRSLCGFLRELDAEERMLVLEELRVWAGAEPGARSTHRMLTVDELLTLVKDGQFDVGAHTVSHPVLSRLTPVEQQREIHQCKRGLEEWLGREVSSFAYPYGSRSDYTAETTRLVAGAGYESACGNFPGFVWQGNDCLQLPRLLMRDWDGESFERRLGAWFGG